MIKKYTDKDYSDMAVKANQEGKRLIKVQEEIEVPYEVYEYEKKWVVITDYDDKGNEVGEHTEQVNDLDKPIMVDEVDEITGKTIKVQKHQTEYKKEWIERLEIVDNPENFQRRFFKTSLGYISREVHNKDGKTEDFLNDTLPSLKVGTPIITYNEDGSQNIDVIVTEEFITECEQQKYKDFYGG